MRGRVFVDNDDGTVEGMSVFVIRAKLLNGAAATALRALHGAAIAALLCATAAATPAHAAFTSADFTVDFNSLPNDATDAQISALLTTAFDNAGYTGTVTVTGAVASNTYTADNNTTGPV